MLSKEQVEYALQEARAALMSQFGDDEAGMLDCFVGKEEYRRLLSCPTDRLPAFIDENVSSEEAIEIDNHLHVCPFCREEVEETRKMVLDWQKMQEEGGSI